MPIKRKATDSGRSSRASKRPTPVPDVGSSDEYSDYEEEVKDDNLKGVLEKFSLESKSAAVQRQDPDFGYKDFSSLSLKPDHANRPLWIDPLKGTITLESFSPLAPQAQDFLTTIAEPLSRPTHLHEYRLTGNSLYAAVSVGLLPQDIINFLDRLSKTPLPDTIKSFILDFTKSYGKIKVVLKHNRFFVESTDPAMLQMLLQDEVIGSQRLKGTEGIIQQAAPKMGGLVIPGTKDAAGVRQASEQKPAEDGAGEARKEDDILLAIRDDDDDEEEVQTRARSHDAQKMMDWIQSREWGLMILDEVHVVPASMFRKVTSAIACQSKLGLTATLLREDDKIKDLNFLIGPKLYEANWMELAEQGHIAKVQCAEVWCPMTTEFYSEYMREKSRKAALLYIMNPRKFQACQFLIDYHEKRGDKVIVFSDNVYALQRYALKLNKAYIYGGTPQNERMRILENFQHNEQVNTIFLSKIGDTSLDLPEATCLIQISSHYGSRRQEAQRLGRILRAKRRNDEGFNAFFYSLVSKDTDEMFYSSKRQAFLVDQGYAFKVITHLQGIENLEGLAYATPSERRELLQEVMLQNETSAEVEHVTDDLFSGRSGGQRKGAVKRSAATLSGLAGGEDMAYIEYNKSRNKQLKDKVGHHPLFRKLERERLKRKKELEDFMR
ncbi:TFIIH complex helicase Ssl2 [Aspergillus luchuensis]|uniref:TFIIH complex helicase Ssl2 n=1 Tax=Aspergillus kawachii TaxID=1069201 RepID=A0A146FRY8_ASPKA|nr:TFIIH complex helicase Ssl2 [Aspergillus luchuensis]